MSRRPRTRAALPLLAWAAAAERARQKRRRLVRRGGFIALGCAAVLGSALFPPAPRLVWNASASAPVGLYAVAPKAVTARGDMVVAWPPIGVRRLAAVRHYLPLAVPLVKRIGAADGDLVCARGSAITVNGGLVAVRRQRDPSGRSLPWWRGCVRLSNGVRVLLSDRPDSFDGRYFGPTEARDIVGKARLLWAR